MRDGFSTWPPKKIPFPLLLSTIHRLSVGWNPLSQPYSHRAILIPPSLPSAQVDVAPVPSNQAGTHSHGSPPSVPFLLEPSSSSSTGGGGDLMMVLWKRGRRAWLIHLLPCSTAHTSLKLPLAAFSPLLFCVCKPAFLPPEREGGRGAGRRCGRSSFRIERLAACAQEGRLVGGQALLAGFCWNRQQLGMKEEKGAKVGR